MTKKSLWVESLFGENKWKNHVSQKYKKLERQTLIFIP